MSDTESEKKRSNMKTLPKIQTIENDQEYMDGYFKICDLLNRKRVFTAPPKDNNKKSNKEETQEAIKKRQSDIAKLNARIRKEDSLFWKMVDRGLKFNKDFAVEQLASFYCLDTFEKKVLLFFIYLEFYNEANSSYSESELVNLFDCKDSIIERMKSLKHFAYTSALIKNRILIKEGRLSYAQTVQKYALSGEILKMLSNILNGAKLDQEANKKRQPKLCEDVGYERTPQYSLDDVKLKEDVKDKIMFFLSNHKDNSLEKIDAHQTIRNCKNLTFLFYGSPGTGKSMLAEAIASYLGKKMLSVEFPKITSRWFGETDNNISRIFRSAKENDMVLCIDEADTLLYNRTYAAQEHDIRFVNVMLQELERFEGVAVLTTNMDILLDQALERRVSLKIKFEEPNEHVRLQIWQSHIPKTVQLSGDIDFSLLARKYDFSGGYIKNAVLNALRRVSLNKQSIITMEDLVFGANIEKEGIFNKDKKNTIIGFATQ